MPCSPTHSEERGDPRGELIALQVAEAEGRGTEKSVRRADELLARHGKDWLGTLAPIVYRARFRRGAPDILELEPAWKGSPKAWEDHARSPVLATVTRIVEGKTTPEVMAAFVGSPAMAGLRHVTIHANAVADALDHHAPPELRHVESRLWKRGTYARRFVERVLPIVEKVPTVTSVECMDNAFDALAASKAFERITSLAVRVDRDRWPAREARVASLPAHVQELAVFLYDNEKAVALLEHLPRTIRSYRVNERAVFSIEGDALTLRLQLLRKADLDPARSSSGLVELLTLLRRVKALRRIEVKAHIDDFDRSAFASWRGVEIGFERVFESGLTRGFSHDGVTYW